MADKSTAIPVGVCENVPVQVTQHCLILTDFVVLEMPEDDNMSIILGRPFLNTAGAVIDCNKGKVTFNVDDKEHTVYFPKRIDKVYGVNTIFNVKTIKVGSIDCPIYEPKEEYQTLVIGSISIQYKKRKMNNYNFGEVFEGETTSTGRPSRASTRIRRSYNEDVIAPSFDEGNGDPNASSFPCYDFLSNAGLLDDFLTLVRKAGLTAYMEDERKQYYMLTKIFVESFKFNNKHFHPSVAFKIYGNPVTMKLKDFCAALDIAPAGTARKIEDNPRVLLELYREITNDDCRTIQRGKIRNIQLPAIKYFAYYLATSILGRENTSNISSYHLAFLIAALTGETPYHLGSVIARRLSNKGPIYGGIIASRILARLDLPLDPTDVEIPPVRLDIAAMKSHQFVTADSSMDNIVYRMLFADGDEREVLLPQTDLFSVGRKPWSRSKEEVDEQLKIQGFHQQHDSEDAEPSYDYTVTYPVASSSTYRNRVVLRHTTETPLHGDRGNELHLGQKPKLGGGSFLDATIAKSRQIENTETPNENAATPVNSPESVEYSSDDLDEDYVELDDDFIEKCNATTDARKIKKLLAEHAVRYKLSPDPKFATSPINIRDKDYDFSLDLSHIAIVEKTPFCGTEKESVVEHMTEKRTPDDAEELLAKIGRNHDDWSTPEPTPTPIVKKRGMIKLNDEDMREAKKSLKEKGIKPEDVKNLPPIEDLCEITPPSSMIEDPLYPEGHPKRVEQDSQLTKTSAPSKKKKKKHKNVVESSEPVNDPNSISISDAETESGNEHEEDNDKNDTPDKEEIEKEPEKHAKNKKYTKEDFITEKHGNEREPWVQKQMPFPAKKLKSKEEEHYNKFCDWMKPLFLQIPLTDAIKLPPYSKYLKDIVTNKRKIPNEEISTMLANYSFNGKIPKKLGDPGIPTIPCSIKNNYVRTALCDLGAGVSVMPFSLYKRLDLDKLIPTDISLQMADKSTAIPVGLCENVPVQVTQHCLILTDFVVLEMPEDDNMSIILGRPFLNTAGAVIDCNKGMVTFNVDDKEHTVYFPKRIDKDFEFHRSQTNPMVRYKIYNKTIDLPFSDFCTAIRVPRWGSCEKIRGTPRELSNLYTRICNGRSFSNDSEIQLSGKSSEFMRKALFYQNIDGAWQEVEARGPHTIGGAQGGPRGHVWPPRPASDAPFGLLIGFDLKTHERSRQKPSREPPHRETPSREPKSPLALRRDGELEEIITAITANASPSTSHVSPIHV
ncbi:hypothetical protein QYE76_030452 [Lolium multiflorum]|uniref:Arabidopsis retrotransposon Orf1 C-terminal domain-containing protein n=1 Tax=Lolium multiflorum TaxID=4521 RepID=A0AAD8QT44_LOLMU|nr:hypothetical protein QYE76_030452 [Lolium multiflorum]